MPVISAPAVRVSLAPAWNAPAWRYGKRWTTLFAFLEAPSRWRSARIGGNEIDLPGQFVDVLATLAAPAGRGNDQVLTMPFCSRRSVARASSAVQWMLPRAISTCQRADSINWSQSPAYGSKHAMKPGRLAPAGTRSGACRLSTRSALQARTVSRYADGCHIVLGVSCPPPALNGTRVLGHVTSLARARALGVKASSRAERSDGR